MGGPAKVALALIASSFTLGARAAAPEEIGLEARCTPPGVEPGVMLTILEAEMAPVRVRLLDSARPESHPETILIMDRCVDAAASLSLTVSREGENDTLTLELAGIQPEARARTVALLGAEAMRSPPPEPAPETADAPDAAPPESTNEKPARPKPRKASRSGSLPRSDRRQPPEDVDPLPPSEPSPWLGRGATTLRFVPNGSGVFLGGAAGGEWGPLGAGVLVLGTDRASELGHVQVFAFAGTASLEAAVEGDQMGVRLDTEVGSAFASGAGLVSGTPSTKLHLALSGNLWGRLPVSEALSVETSTGFGYARSLGARIQDYVGAAQTTVGLDGWFANVSVAVRR